MALALAASLIGSAFGLMFPMLIVKLFEGITRTRDLHLLNVLAGSLIAVFLLQGLFSFIQSYLLAFIGERIVFDLRTSLYGHLQGLSFDFFGHRRIGDLVSRLSSDVTLMRTVLTTNVAMLFSQVTMVIGSLVLMLNMNARLTIFILSLAPMMIVVALLFSKKIKNDSTLVQDQLAHSTVVVEEGLQSIRIVKSFGREAFETDRYAKAMEKTYHSSLRVALHSNLFISLLNFMAFCAIAAIIWFGGREVIADRLTLPKITGFLVYGIMIAGNLGAIAQLSSQLSAAIGGTQRVFDLLDVQSSIQDKPNAIELSSCQGQITFQKVCFSYDSVTPVIQNLTLEVRPGEVLALVGPSGAGKSTIFNLIPRFFDPASGSVLIDGHDVRTLSQSSLRSHLAIVPQETMLFGGTVRENLRYGRLDATEEEIVSAARDANAHDFIMNLPEKYETIVGERGINLSGGQRQRLAIARALLKSPKILLLDEATSALDNESEELVQEALNRVMHNNWTTIIIAHRLSTIKFAHRIAVMEKGRITELGTHDELMSLNRLYARLYAMQFRNLEAPCYPYQEGFEHALGEINRGNDHPDGLIGLDGAEHKSHVSRAPA